jgi:hypothetical protein
MINVILLHVGSIVITLWGIAHIIPTRQVVNGFGSISADNKRIITMEWVAEGLTLCFIGLLVLAVTLWGGAPNAASLVVYRASALMLLVMAIWTAATGANTAIIPIKVCPLVKTAVAVLFVLGTMF